MLELSLRLLDVVVHSSGCLDIRDVTRDKGDGLFEAQRETEEEHRTHPCKTNLGEGTSKSLLFEVARLYPLCLGQGL